MNENWTFEELQNAQRLMGRARFTGEDIQEIFSLYNRINNTNKKPTGCGKCVINALNNLQRNYDYWKDKQ